MEDQIDYAEHVLRYMYGKDDVSKEADDLSSRHDPRIRHSNCSAELVTKSYDMRHDGQLWLRELAKVMSALIHSEYIKFGETTIETSAKEEEPHLLSDQFTHFRITVYLEGDMKRFCRDYTNLIESFEWRLEYPMLVDFAI